MVAPSNNPLDETLAALDLPLWNFQASLSSLTVSQSSSYIESVVCSNIAFLVSTIVSLFLGATLRFQRLGDITFHFSTRANSFHLKPW
jgi:hypothetical protein